MLRCKKSPPALLCLFVFVYVASCVFVMIQGLSLFMSCHCIFSSSVLIACTSFNFNPILVCIFKTLSVFGWREVLVSVFIRLSVPRHFFVFRFLRFLSQLAPSYNGLYITWPSPVFFFCLCADILNLFAFNKIPFTAPASIFILYNITLSFSFLNKNRYFFHLFV